MWAEQDEFPPPGVGHDLGLVTQGSPESWATYSPDMRLRYALGRWWEPLLPVMVICGLNPSTAGHVENDPTIIKEIALAKYNHCGAILKVNVWPFRATDQADLLAAVKRGEAGNGDINDEVIFRCVRGPMLALAVAAWGKPRWIGLRHEIIRQQNWQRRGRWKCFRRTVDGFPWHPLYLPNETRVIEL